MGGAQDAIQRKIGRLCDCLGDGALLSLLLIRYAFREDASGQDGAWRNAADGRDGSCAAFIAEALDRIAPRFPFARELMERNGRQSMDEAALQELASLLDAGPMRELSSAEILEAYLQSRASARQAAPERGGFYTPKAVAQCLVQMLKPERGAVYDPCCGSGALLCQAQMHSGRLELFGQARDGESSLLCQMSLALRGMRVDLGGEPADALLNDRHGDKRFDYILANPPFNTKRWYRGSAVLNDERWRFGLPPWSNANFAWLQHVISRLRPGGRAAVILPNGTLTTRNCQEAGIRREILRGNLVEAIITLPPGLFPATRIPFCIWLLERADGEERKILFVDAARMEPAIRGEITAAHIERLGELVDGHRRGTLRGGAEWYAAASLDAVRRRGYILSPNLYAAPSRPGPAEIGDGRGKLLEVIDEISALPVDGALLEKIVQWRSAEAARAWTRAHLLEIYDVFGGVTKGRECFGRGVPLLDVRTVIRAPYAPDCLPSRVEATRKEQEKYDIRRGDVLLNRTSETIGELACCCIAVSDRDAVYGGFVKRLRPRGEQGMNPLYAAGYFRSEIYRWEVEDVSTVYTSYASMDNEKLSQITVYFPDADMQERLGGTLFEAYQYRERCGDERLKALLERFEGLLIQQYITRPILCARGGEEDYQCK